MEKSILLSLNIFMFLLNFIFMYHNYNRKYYKGALLNCFSLGFVSSTLLYQLLNL